MTPHPHAYPARHTTHPLGIHPGDLLAEQFGRTGDNQTFLALLAVTGADAERHVDDLLAALTGFRACDHCGCAHCRRRRS